MIFELSFFLSLALALSSLDAVTAIFVPRSVDGEQLNRRYSGAELTFYTQDGVAGACGLVHQDTDFVVSLPADKYDGGSHCGDQVLITYRGLQVTAVAADLCPGCGGDNIDLSIAAFLKLSSLGDGRLFGATWEFL